jgi:putative membrane protein
MWEDVSMHTVATALVVLIGVVHCYFLVLEMFLWTTPFGQKTFGRPREEMEATKVLAGNQGLYNGFLAAGLFWGAFATGGSGRDLRLFFLGCVLVAGVYGGATAARKILYVQALPALIAIACVLLFDRAS